MSFTTNRLYEEVDSIIRRTNLVLVHIPGKLAKKKISITLHLFLCIIIYNYVSNVLFKVYNKIDQISIEEVDRLARQPDSVVVRYMIFLVHLKSQ